jgi:hypothetical protein
MKIVPIATIAKLVKEKQLMLLSTLTLEVARTDLIHKSDYWYWAMLGVTPDRVNVEKLSLHLGMFIAWDIYHLMFPNHRRRSEPFGW